MIIRKPYAFLIKNFRKIHIFLLVLSLYVAYKLINVSSFVNEFMRLGTYDLYSDPITNHITFFLLVAVFLLVVGSASLVLLLRYKNKPWKIYLVPVIEYLFLFFVLNVIKSFFDGYTSDIDTTDLRMSKDLLMIFLVVQLPSIAIYVMRVFGLDIQKFNFNSDKEFLELSEEDREEIEISFSIDKNTFKRLYKKFIRYASYFYIEHKLICRIVIGILVLVIGYNSYKFIFVTNKTYKQGDYYSANGYTVKVNNVYFTDKDYNGRIIEENSNFVILDLSIKNNSAPQKIKLENFHLRSGVNDYITTERIYASEFQDLGKTYDSVKELRRDETLNCIVVYKVDKKINKNKFVLYHQELGGDNKLRKISLKVVDISKIKDPVTISLGEEMKVDIVGKRDVINFDFFEVSDTEDYYVRNCVSTGCNVDTRTLTSDGTYKIMKLDFGSEEYDSKNMIDFLNKYGKIIYKDSSGNDEIIEVNNLIDRKYFGKSLFLKVPSDITDDSDVRIEFVIRNKNYIYKLT